MKYWKKAVIYCLIAAVCLAGISFPSAVSAVQDLQIARSHETVDATTVQLNMSSNLSILQKLEVVRDATSVVELESAQKMEYEEARTELYKGIGRLLDGQILFLNLSSFSEKEHSIQLRMYEGKSVILWDFILEDKVKNQMEVLVDDDTGVILAIRCLVNGNVSDDMQENEIYALDSNTIVSTLEGYGYIVAEELQRIADQYITYLSGECGKLNADMGMEKSKSLCIVTLTDDEGETYELTTYVSGDEFSLN